MAIAWDNAGSANGSGVSSLTVDITAASVGAACYCMVIAGVTLTSGFTFAGWQQLCDIEQGSNTHFGLYRRIKQSGDTTFSVGWGSSHSGVAVWSSYTGLLSSCPEEGFGPALHTVSSVTYTSPSATPADNTRWALVAACARSTTTSGETWTASTSTIRAQAVNASSNWCPAAIGDTGAAVTKSSHNYQMTLSSAESTGGAVLCYLIPSTSGTPVYPAPVIKGQAVQRAAYW